MTTADAASGRSAITPVADIARLSAIDLLADFVAVDHHAKMSDDHWTYQQCEDATVEKIATLGAIAPDEHRADYLRVQVRLAIRQASRHGRSGLADDEPVVA